MNPETREHILERHCDNGGRFDCGCYYLGDHSISLCQFHTGYDECIDRFRPAAAEDRIGCAHCHDTGDTSDGRPCWKCGGKGFIAAAEEPTLCPQRHDHGIPSERCPDCGGRGYVKVPAAEQSTTNPKETT